jgi:hypothetical protein
MSARRVEIPGALSPQVTIKGRQTRLALTPNSVVIHKNGIEFRTTEPFAAWTEMTVELQSPKGGARLHCTGVVISCSGNQHFGYHVSMVFTSLSKSAQAQLNTLAFVETR